MKYLFDYQYNTYAYCIMRFVVKCCITAVFCYVFLSSELYASEHTKEDDDFLAGEENIELENSSSEENTDPPLPPPSSILPEPPSSSLQEQDPGTDNEENADTPELTLFEQTLVDDVETASNQEILEWAEALGLSTRDAREKIEDRIFEYYGVERYRKPEEQRGSDEESIIRIDSARRSDFFRIVDQDEDYLRLIGEVFINVQDGDALHTIKAEEVIVNLNTDVLSAYGDVVYSLTRDSTVETFTGDSILFHLDDWDGVFVRGITETVETIDSSELTFTIGGDRNTRAPNEVIVIENGRVTSSKADPPNYEIRAERMWILSPGEWGFRKGKLYVGRIPVFYFPALFLPGDRLFFHPAFGNRTREGNFIQTTTYLFGESEEAEPPISIMRLGDDPSEEDRVIKGLFLRIPDSPKEVKRPEWSMKIMADVYTTMGWYTGIEGSMPNLGPINTLDWQFGIGGSRNIYKRQENFVNYYSDKSKVREHWNKGNFFGTSLPFRYEGEVNTRVSVSSFSLSIDFLLLSDTQFRRDYGDRSESIDWSFIVTPIEDEEDETSKGTVNSLNWKANLQWSPSLPFLRPWIESISFSRIAMDLNMRSKVDSERPDAVKRKESDQSPEEKFFYPQNTTVPDASIRISGTLFSFPISENNSVRKEKRQKKNEIEETEVLEEDTEDTGDLEDRGSIEELRIPWDEEPAEEKKNEMQGYRFHFPELAGDLTGASSSGNSTLSLKYSLSPTFRYDRLVDNAKWTTPSDVEWEWKHATLQVKNNGSFTLRGALPDNAASIESKLDLEQRYQSVEVIADLSKSEVSSLMLNTFRYTGESGKQTSKVSFLPFSFWDSWSTTALNYNISSLVFKREFTRLREDETPLYNTKTGGWNESRISAHQAQVNIHWIRGVFKQSLTTQAELDPRPPAYTGVFTSVLGPFTSSFSTGYKEVEEKGEKTWEPDPLVENHTLTFFQGKFSLQQNITYDLEEVHIKSAQTSLKLWPLSFTLNARRSVSYRFQGVGGWVSRENEDLRWTDASMGLNGKYTVKWWKRRITLTLNGNLSTNFDFLRYTNSTLDFGYGMELNIHRFVDLKLSARSTNTFLYQYIEDFSRETDRPHRNFFQDIWDSFLFFDDDAREKSFFKLQDFSLSLVHDLEDWILELTYKGSPKLNEGKTAYEWESTLTVLVRWQSITELRRNIEVKENGRVKFLP